MNNAAGGVTRAPARNKKRKKERKNKISSQLLRRVRLRTKIFCPKVYDRLEFRETREARSTVQCTPPQSKHLASTRLTDSSFDLGELITG